MLCTCTSFSILYVRRAGVAEAIVIVDTTGRRGHIGDLVLRPRHGLPGLVAKQVFGGCRRRSRVSGVPEIFMVDARWEGLQLDTDYYAMEVHWRPPEGKRIMNIMTIAGAAAASFSYVLLKNGRRAYLALEFWKSTHGSNKGSNFKKYRTEP